MAPSVDGHTITCAAAKSSPGEYKKGSLLPLGCLWCGFATAVCMGCSSAMPGPFCTCCALDLNRPRRCTLWVGKSLQVWWEQGLRNTWLKQASAASSFILFSV